MSAIIYCLRCLVGHDIPLNQGCLNPVTVIIPPGCMLDPSENAAVVGELKRIVFKSLKYSNIIDDVVEVAVYVKHLFCTVCPIFVG